ncbi:MAG: hypothetical protein LBN38_08590 [Verrucomicrobiota bacterium]|jgi:hypothetical protein|nr:hypothetical protein [Verrucomicrobiota bacterium]
MRIDSIKNFGEHKCPACACVTSGNENRCPICHYAFPVRSTLQNNLLWIVLLFLSLFCIPFLLAILR